LIIVRMRAKELVIWLVLDERTRGARPSHGGALVYDKTERL
jgi:hypothetical protein